MLPVTIRTDSEAVKVDRVHAIQHWRNSAEMPLREGDERRLPPAVVYLHCHPVRSSVASFHRTLTRVGDSITSSARDPNDSEAMSRVPLQPGYPGQPQKELPSLLFVRRTIGLPHEGQGGTATESPVPTIRLSFSSPCLGQPQRHFGRQSSPIQSPRLPKPESTEGGRRVSVLKRPEGAPVNLG